MTSMNMQLTEWHVFLYFTTSSFSILESDFTRGSWNTQQRFARVTIKATKGKRFYIAGALNHRAKQRTQLTQHRRLEYSLHEHRVRRLPGEKFKRKCDFLRTLRARYPPGRVSRGWVDIVPLLGTTIGPGSNLFQRKTCCFARRRSIYVLSRYAHGS